MNTRRPAFLAAVASLVLVATACAGAEDEAATPPPEELRVQVASYDLAVGTGRFMVGLLTGQNELVAGGMIDMEFTPPGGAAGQRARGAFLPLPEEEHEEGQEELPHATGVYASQVTFEEPGTWRVVVTATVDGQRTTGSTTFEVIDEPRFPAAGDRAPRSDNLTVGSKDVPPAAVDSRAIEDGEIPDPDLHRVTIAEAIAESRPVLAVFSTPTFCESRFCGPVTDMVASLAADYPEAAEYVHVEIWKDRQNNVVNRAAAEWVLRDDTLLEPWVFLVGENGRI
ncbi:MAG: hypothetical protein ACRDHJ_12675, partial [Actinomycetota bacterium]